MYIEDLLCIALHFYVQTICYLQSTHDINWKFISDNFFLLLILEETACILVSLLVLIHYIMIFQLIECPSIYELMACPHFNWQHIPLLEIWREKKDSDHNPQLILESYPPEGSIKVFKDALSSNSVSSKLGLVCSCWFMKFYMTLWN